ncbi:replication-relaxation family protein [Amycolatopsis roodepoortensis]|uniref:replication-relaxation family protein n=1 Tax=Amycolatopsis roodepoortensis TaxID=700274 RepID=UPI00214CBA27|nr:replication-relaxation family protein [Amycolatopsis roodepoortensis]UUV28602.1 replication-relaxation family protein [Amycolatopsis roodepoortensis]
MITTTTRQHTLRGHLPGRHTARAASSVEHQAMLASRLTARDKWLLALLHEHRVLTSFQIQDAAFPSGRSARQRIRDLYLWRAVSRFQPFQQLGSAPMHYVLGPAGAAVLAAEHGLEVKELGYRHDRAMAIAHNQRLAHTIGVNDFFTSLIARTRHTSAGEALAVWWSEARCARHFGDLVIPDGYGRWRTGSGAVVREVEWFLEYDTGTESLTKVGRKLAAYARLAESTGIATPVLVWLPTTRREAGARTALAGVHAGLDNPRAVPVATAAADLLDPTSPHPSPAEAVWLPLTSARHGRAGPRYNLADLADAWPGLAPPAGQGGEDGEGEAGDAAVASPYRLPPPNPIPPRATPNRGARGKH